MVYNPQKIEKKWQKLWEETGIYQVPDKIRSKRNFYHLVMFPYSSGDLHIGHWYNFVGGDVYARLKKMQGYNVMSPIGFDAFGLPAENAAISHGIHPRTWTYKNIQRMRKQLRSVGACYDWSREVITCDPEYYKWTQWIFLQLYKQGLVYQKKAPANWCPKCKSILANEQAEGGKCWRCESEVGQREVEQWFFKIKDYAEDLLEDLGRLDWPETTKIMQRNWIGKSEGWTIKFKIQNSKFKIPVFTTRVDTLFGCTYLVLSSEHPIIENLKSEILNLKFVEKYIEESKKRTDLERISEAKEKSGIEIKGLKAINPANSRKIPIWVADYVLVHYGTGAIMAVAGHDQRDFDFARKYNLPVIEVIKPALTKKVLSKRDSLIVSDGRFEMAYEGEGFLINSGRFIGLSSQKARERIGEWLLKKGLAQRATYYKLRDWLISRQRYWGAPIPMVLCQRCGWQPVSEKDLPVLLPQIKDFKPTGEGRSPLAKAKEFIGTSCPKCGGPAQRETDTMDTFICSSWYFLRYADPKNEKEFISKEKLKTWLPVNMYVGGAEHSVMHLLYARFFTKALQNLGYLDFSEPFLSLRHQGIILGPDGQKMSKSRGNVVEPGEQIKKYGSDALRIYLCFMGPYEQGGPWQPKGIVGIYRFLNRIWNLVSKNLKPSPAAAGREGRRERNYLRLPERSEGEEETNSLWLPERSEGEEETKSLRPSQIQNPKLERLLHKTIKKVTEDIENFRFNTVISTLMIFVNGLSKEPIDIQCQYLKPLLLLLAPFAPHLAEELWQKHITEDSEFKVENSIHNQPWPKYNPELIKEEKIVLVIQVNGKVRDKIEVKAPISEKETKEFALSRKKIKKWMARKKIKKVIFVPGKLINIVV